MASGWEFFRNDDLDANDFFNKYQKASPADYTPVPKLRQNIFGANLGGPLFIPHVFNTSRQKTFFFYNQEWRRIIQSSAPATNPTMPDADRPVGGYRSAVRGSCLCTEPGHLCSDGGAGT